MAGETTTTTVTGSINTSFIDKVMSNYALDLNVYLPHVRFAQVANGTGTAAFTVATKGSASAITEATGMSNTALTTANTTVAASEVGITRTVTKKASRFNVMGDAGLHDFIIEDGRKLCLEKMETDALATNTSASTSVGTSGATMTLANAAGAISQGSINKMRGSTFFVWSTFQARDARTAIATSSAPILQFIGGDRLMAGPDATGLTGYFAGKPVYETNLVPAASSDKVGIYATDGYTDPAYAPIGGALGWMPESEEVVTASLPGKVIAVTACYGFAEINDYCYVKIVTIGS